MKARENERLRLIEKLQQLKRSNILDKDIAAAYGFKPPRDKSGGKGRGNALNGG